MFSQWNDIREFILIFGVCRIDIHFVIKIADFGLSEDVYSKNYFRQSGSDKSVKLPVKWMAPESLSDGVFSEKSDVVGFSLELYYPYYS